MSEKIIKVPFDVGDIVYLISYENEIISGIVKRITKVNEIMLDIDYANGKHFTHSAYFAKKHLFATWLEANNAFAEREKDEP